jgi:putative mRNA 3-end processing factor
VTESTFGLPVYQWPKPKEVFSEMNAWWEGNRAKGITSIVSAYTLGKAQRIIQNIDHSLGPVYCHDETERMNETIRAAGIHLKATHRITDQVSRDTLRRALVIAPGSALNSSWMRRFKEYSTAAASGWMLLRGKRNWHHVDKGFVLSDHADWSTLNQTIRATGCERVIVTHGYSTVFALWLREQGYQALAEKTTYDGENEETE